MICPLNIVRRAVFLWTVPSKKRKKGRNNYVNKTLTAFYFFRCDDSNRYLLQKTRHRCKRLRLRRTLSRTLAHSFCLRYIIFFGSYFHRLCGTIRMEIRYRLHMDRNRQRPDRFPFGMGNTRKTNQNHDTSFGFFYNARIFRHAIQQQTSENWRIHNNIHISYSVYSFFVQWIIKIIRHGLQYRLHYMYHHNGRTYRYIRYCRRLHGNSYQ